MSTVTTTALEPYTPTFSELGESTLLGFLAGYGGFTRDAYTLDLRHSRPAPANGAVHSSPSAASTSSASLGTLKTPAGPATVARRLCTIVGSYR